MELGRQQGAVLRAAESLGACSRGGTLCLLDGSLRLQSKHKGRASGAGRLLKWPSESYWWPGLGGAAGWRRLHSGTRKHLTHDCTPGTGRRLVPGGEGLFCLPVVLAPHLRRVSCEEIHISSWSVRTPSWVRLLLHAPRPPGFQTFGLKHWDGCTVSTVTIVPFI